MTSKNWKKYTQEIVCTQCGEKFDAYIYNLKRGWGKYCSQSCSKKGNKNRTGQTFTEEQKQQISETLSRKFANGELTSPFAINKTQPGDKSPNWKGGISKSGQALRTSKEYKEWHDNILERDDYTCQYCFTRGGELEVDHVKPFNAFGDLKLDMDNGKTLCINCHRKVSFGYNLKPTTAKDLRVPFIDTLIELAKSDDKIILVVCDVGFKHADRFKEMFPGRYFNLGVTEMSSMVICAAMALDGWKPYFYSMINFSIFRPYEAVRNAVCFHNANVKIIGVSGSEAYKFLGMSHNIMPAEDINALKNLPNLRIYTPQTTQQTIDAITRINNLSFPAYIRL